MWTYWLVFWRREFLRVKFLRNGVLGSSSNAFGGIIICSFYSGSLIQFWYRYSKDDLSSGLICLAEWDCPSWLFWDLDGLILIALNLRSWELVYDSVLKMSSFIKLHDRTASGSEKRWKCLVDCTLDNFLRLDLSESTEIWIVLNRVCDCLNLATWVWREVSGCRSRSGFGGFF